MGNIKNEDTFGLKYYEYGQAFMGGYCGMRFRVARDPMEAVWFLPAEKKEEGRLTVCVWPEPYSYDVAAEESKTRADFPFTEQGKIQMTEWLNEQYESRIEEWNKVKGKIFV